MKQLLTGNQAVARGVWEAGCVFAAAYPGTPSTEITEELKKYPEIMAEWAPNEKVALEGVIGASLAGGRGVAAMKHVGLNVAADPLFTFSYTGVEGGAVIVTADEPGMHSSQNEQDNRNYAKAAKLPMLEPSDSQEALEMTKAAFDISEQFNVPVLLRLTTRVCHSKSVVNDGEREQHPLKQYQRQIGKFVCVPAVSRQLRIKKEQQLRDLQTYAESTPFNRVEYHDRSVGVICSGMCYYYAQEVFGQSASYLKLGFTYPLPNKLIANFCSQVDKIYVIEENDPYLEDYIRGLGFAPLGKSIFPAWGEMTPDVLRQSLTDAELPTPEYDRNLLVDRPPTLCAGCPHRGLFYELSRRKDLIVCGDIGCYTLGSAKPFAALDSTICMGASISMAHGAAKVLAGQNKLKVVSVIGDSTFFHSGVTSLLGSAYNGDNAVHIILDNRITGMTGHQENPGSGYTLQGTPVKPVDIEALCRAVGIRHILTVNPNDLDSVHTALDELLALDEPSVLITRWPCALKKFSPEDKTEFPTAFRTKYKVADVLCSGCKLCLRAGCPALSYDGQNNKTSIDHIACLGCGVCAQICSSDAIIKEAE